MFGIPLGSSAAPPYNDGRCDICRSPKSVRSVTFLQNIGLVVVRLSKQVQGVFCGRCIRKAFWSCTLTTLFFGWWGFVSFIATPIILIANVVTLLRSHRQVGLQPALLGASTILGIPFLALTTLVLLTGSSSRVEKGRFDPPNIEPLTPDQFRFYLKNWPNGRWAVQARARWTWFAQEAVKRADAVGRESKEGGLFLGILASRALRDERAELRVECSGRSELSDGAAGAVFSGPSMAPIEDRALQDLDRRLGDLMGAHLVPCVRGAAADQPFLRISYRILPGGPESPRVPEPAPGTAAGLLGFRVEAEFSAYRPGDKEPVIVVKGRGQADPSIYSRPDMKPAGGSSSERHYPKVADAAFESLMKSFIQGIGGR
jgi:hypothetical protein